MAVGTMSEWDELDDGVYRRRYAELDQNIGLVVGSDGLLVIDSRSHPHHGRVLRDQIAEISSLPVRWVVNTHWHWDHCFGNSVFSDAVIVGHRLCRSGLIETGPLQLDRLKSADWFPEDERQHLEEVEIVPPSLTFDELTPLWVGDRRIEMAYYGKGHTDADIVVQVGGVTFVGDLVEEGNPPAFVDAYPQAWIATLRRLTPDLRSTVVPGHGDAVDGEFVAAQCDEIEAAVGGAAVYPAAVMDQISLRLDAEAD